MALSKAIFGAGCFWGVQYYFDQVPGVINSYVGYTGGRTENPTYEDVCNNGTGHAEVVLLEFDKDIVTYETILKHFFRIHDPTQLNRQGPDIGDQYRSEIFFNNESQKTIAEKVLEDVQKNTKGKIVTQITPVNEFYPAEDYHQKYSEKTGRGMCHTPYIQMK